MIVGSGEPGSRAASIVAARPDGLVVSEWSGVCAHAVEQPSPHLEELAVVDGSHLQPDAFACLQQHPTLQAVIAGLDSRKKNEVVDKLLGLPPAGSQVPWRSV